MWVEKDITVYVYFHFIGELRWSRSSLVSPYMHRSAVYCNISSSSVLNNTVWNFLSSAIFYEMAATTRVRHCGVTVLNFFRRKWFSFFSSFLFSLLYFLEFLLGSSSCLRTVFVYLKVSNCISSLLNLSPSLVLFLWQGEV